MKAVGVMQVVDTLETGGAERVALNIANHLPREQYRSFLCTTRRDGPLESAIDPSVGRLRLERKARFDLGAIRKFLKFARQNDIEILHAHGASLFIATIASRLASGLRVIWHDHFGRGATEQRPVWLYRLACSQVSGVIAVNENLAEWSRGTLHVPAARVWYVPNFVEMKERLGVPSQLPGRASKRIVCVANFRPQKDHLNLIRALQIVVARVPDAHVLLVGPITNDAHMQSIRAEIETLGLARNVSFLGQRTDVPRVLHACDVGVLASNSEGLPLSLLEYGAAGLAAVATNVGQCAEVLDHGNCGILVPPRSPEALAGALLTLLESPERRADLASFLHARIHKCYSAESAIRQISGIYDSTLNSSATSHGVERNDARKAQSISPATTKTN